MFRESYTGLHKGCTNDVQQGRMGLRNGKFQLSQSFQNPSSIFYTAVYEAVARAKLRQATQTFEYKNWRNESLEPPGTLEEKLLIKNNHNLKIAQNQGKLLPGELEQKLGQNESLSKNCGSSEKLSAKSKAISDTVRPRVRHIFG